MDNLKRLKISGGLYFISAALGAGSFFAANMCTSLAKTSGWMAVIFGMILCIPPVVLMRVSEKMSGKNSVMDIFSQYSGLNTAVKTLLSAVFFVLTVFLCSHFSYIIRIWILQDVNLYLISGGLCTVLYISLFKDKESLYRTVVLISVLCILGIFVVRCGIVFSGEKEKLMPFFEKERFTAGMAAASVYSFGIFATAALCTKIYAKKLTFGENVIGLAGTAVILILLIFSCNILLGAEQTAKSFDAIVLAMRKSNILGRGDILFFIVWMCFIASAFCSSGFAPKALTEGKTKYPWWVYFLYCLAVFIFSITVSRYMNAAHSLIFVLVAGCGSALYSVSVIAFLTCISKRKENGDEI